MIFKENMLFLIKNEKFIILGSNNIIMKFLLLI